jgi:hypothetical protein
MIGSSWCGLNMMIAITVVFDCRPFIDRLERRVCDALVMPLAVTTTRSTPTFWFAL